MSNYYTKDQFVEYAKQQIIENNDLIKAWNIVIEALKKYDNKVLTKRFINYVGEELKKEFSYAWLHLETFMSFTYFNLYVRDNDKYKTTSGSYNYVDYISSLSVALTEDNRIIADNTIAAIENIKSHVVEVNRQLQCEIKVVDDLELEYKVIKKSIENFKRKNSSYLNKLFKF